MRSVEDKMGEEKVDENPILRSSFTARSLRDGEDGHKVEEIRDEKDEDVLQVMR